MEGSLGQHLVVVSSLSKQNEAIKTVTTTLYLMPLNLSATRWCSGIRSIFRLRLTCRAHHVSHSKKNNKQKELKLRFNPEQMGEPGLIW